MLALRSLAAGLLVTLTLNAAEAQEAHRVAGPDEIVSIEVPEGWTVVPGAGADYSQLALFSTGELDIAIVLGCRDKRSADQTADTTQLMDELIESTMTMIEALGNEIIQVGRIEPLVEPWPAFGAVAANGDKTRLMTVVRSPIDHLICNITTLTDNLQGSGELMATVSDIVATARIEPPPNGD